MVNFKIIVVHVLKFSNYGYDTKNSIGYKNAQNNYHFEHFYIIIFNQ